MLNENICLILVQQLSDRAPQWVQETLRKPYSQIQELPEASEGEDDCIFRPSFEIKEVTASYLNFLRDEIRRSSRGKEWSDILTARMNALIPYQGKNLYWLNMLRRHNRF